MKIPEFINQRLSALLKSLLYWIVFLILLFLAGSQLKPIFPDNWNEFVYGIFGTLAALIATRILLKIDKKSFAEYGLVWQKGTLVRFLKGLALGTSIFLLIILTLILFTELQIDRNPKAWNPWAFWYLAIIPLALMEEIAFRSYPFLKLNKVFGLRITQIVISLAFALYHILQGWDFQIAFLGPGIWAFVFGIAAIRPNGIALPTGIHVALNLIQQLIGIKSSANESIWLLKHSETASAEAIAHTDAIGLLTQILVLGCALFITEFHIRKKNKARSFN